MTLCVAWTRSIGYLNELVVASDSRLSGAGHVDYCPKIFALPREDCAIGFCGHTTIAYPFILQTMNYINGYEKARSRALDITDMRNSIISILNEFRNVYRDPIESEYQEENRTTEFIVAGWSWRYQRFEIYKINYDRNAKKFSHHTPAIWKGQSQEQGGRGKKIGIAGNYVYEYRHKLTSLLRQKGKLDRGGFDMEPFEILRDMLRDDEFIDRGREKKGLIGGSPQVIKIYPHPNVLPIACYWGQNRLVHVLGRHLLSYEKTTYPIMDPDTLEMHYPLQSIEN